MTPDTSYLHSTARQRLALFDSFEDFAGVEDGVLVGRAQLQGLRIFAAAQDGSFKGGAVGEVHGARLVGVLRRAQRERPAAVVLLADSGGVRLHEANAGLVAIAEILRAVLEVRAAAIPVIALVGGAKGAFGGMGIVARCANAVVMSAQGRLAMSGPEVIETAHGAAEYDSRDRELVWRTTGGAHRFASGDAQYLVEDSLQAFRRAALAAINAAGSGTAPSLAELEAEHALLAQRIAA